MAREYGFRVFRLELFQDQMKGRDPLPLHVGSAGRDAIIDLIEYAASKGTAFLPVRQPTDVAEPRLPKVSITITSPQSITDGIFHFEVLTGEIDGHRHAVSEDGSRHSLTDASAERGFFATLCFPISEDNPPECLLILETHKGSDVKRRLFSFLSRLSREKKKISQEKNKEERSAARKENREVPPKENFSKYIFNVRQIADSDYFSRLLQEARSATAVFTEFVPSLTGGAGREVQKTLAFSLRTDEQKEKASRIGRRWHRRVREDDNQPHPDAVSELSAAVDLNSDEISDYDEACIKITSKNGESITVRPYEVRDMFTYQISDGPPSTLHYYTKVSPKVTELAQVIGLTIDEIDLAEVEECLSDSNGSTSAQSSEG